MCALSCVSRRLWGILIMINSIFILVQCVALLRESELPATSLESMLATGQIVFVSTRDGNEEIYIMNADGSSQTRLTHNPAADRYPSFSPDGQYIVFVSERAGKNYLYRMRLDGSEQVQLTDHETFVAEPRWSPDGEWIAFISGGLQLYIMRPDGSGITQLTESSAYHGYPTWSADSKKLLFASTQSNEVGIVDNNLYTLNLTDRMITRVTFTTATYDQPAWSPDERYIAFTDRHSRKIYLLDVSSQEITPLLSSDPALDTASTPPEITPSWLPDSEHLVFSWYQEGNAELYVINIFTRELTRLTHNSANDYAPDWGTQP